MDGEVLLSEEERESHLHILGTTREGKSKFIEHLIRGDIRAGNSVFLLDPSDRGDTCYNILRYCAAIGHEKVVLIDPHLSHSHNRLACIQPFNRKRTYKDASVANIQDAIRILFGTASDAETPRIRRYLPAMLRVLWEAEMTLHETLYFSDYENKHYRARRDYILSQVDPLDKDRVTMEGVFKTFFRWETYFSSTVNRLDPFWDTTISRMFGVDSGIDFPKMITEGWVVLVNLYAGLGFEPIHSRLLGTAVINEVIFAIDRLRGRGWKGVSYLYVDEAGRYANRNLADLLSYKGKSGLRVTIAHQYFRQFEDTYVLDAVKNQCKTKLMFDVPNPADRLEMMKLLGYGGDISPDLAQYANQNLPKQNAIFKPPKGTPVRMKIQDVPEPKNKWANKERDEFIFKIINQPWYMHPDDIRGQMEDRFYDAKPAVRPTPPSKGAKANRPPTGGAQKSRPKTIFDD